jgi:hypothetical protein
MHENFSILENFGDPADPLAGVHPEMVDFSSGQGRSDSATAGVARLRRGLPRARTPAWAERRRLWMGTIWSSGFKKPSFVLSQEIDERSH